MTGASPLEIFVAVVEVRPLDEEVFGYEVTGAFVRCYTVAHDEEDAKQKIGRALGESRLTVIAFEWCVQSDAVEWEHPEDEDGEEPMNEALSTGEVVFGEFHVWSNVSSTR